MRQALSERLRRPDVIAYVGLLIVFGALLSRLWGNGFTSGDEGFTATARFRFGGVWEAAVAMATQHGRFYHLVVYPIAQLPYVFDSLAVVNGARIVSSALPFLGFFGFVRELAGRRTALIAGFTVVGLLDTVGGSYNPFHGLPLWFNTGAFLVIASLWLYLRQLRRGGSLHGAYAVFFLSLLFYEINIFYAAAFPLLHHMEPSKPAGLIRANAGWVVALALYFALYWGFRTAYPGSYEGSKELTIGAWRDVTRTIWNFSVNGFFLRWYSPAYAGISLSAASYTLVWAVGLVLSFRVADLTDKQSPARAWAMTAAAMPFVFVPNLLFGFVERYRTWVQAEPYYLGSFSSAFALGLVAALVACGLERSARAKAIKTIIALLILPIGLIVYGNQVHSLDFYNESRRDADRWKAAAEVARKIRTGEIGGRSLCTSTFLKREDPYDYWSAYLTRHSGQPVKLRFGDAPGCDAKLIYVREAHGYRIVVRAMAR